MSYHLLTYSLFFLPIVAVLYQLCPKRFRWMVILFVNYLFFYLISGVLVVYLLAATTVSYIASTVMENMGKKTGLKGKELKKKKRIVVTIGVLVNLTALVMLKYLRVFGIGTDWLAPIGI